MFDFEEYYQEPTEVEYLQYEYEQKLKELLKPKVVDEINQLKEQLEEEKQKNKELQGKIYQLNSKLSDIGKYKQDIEKEFQHNRLEWFKKYMSRTLYKPVSIHVQEDTLSNEFKLKLDNGDVVVIKNKNHFPKYHWEVKEVTAVMFEIYKGNVRYYIDREGSWSDDALEDITNHSIYDEYDESHGSYRTYYTSKEECQKICDRENKKLEEKYSKPIYEVVNK